MAPAAAADSKGAGELEDLGEIAREADNPVGQLWLLVFQYDFQIAKDSQGDRRYWSSLTFQPVAPLRLTDSWRVITRPIFSLNSVTHPNRTGAPWERETCLGDTTLLMAFTTSPENAEWLWGVGPTWQAPTAADDVLGAGKWSAGPAALLFYIGPKWILGAIWQNWFSFAGDSDRRPVSLTDFQYVIRYRPTALTEIGMTPNIAVDWTEADGWSVPVGLGGEILFLAGKIPVRVGIEVQYYLTQPDEFGNQWNIRLIVTPVIPAPAWAERPLLGG